MTAPYGSIDPNSQHQLWSRWIIGIEASPQKLPSVREVIANARRYFAAAFKSSVGRVRCDQQGTYYCITVEIEGPPAHDPEYVAALQRDVEARFVAKGFGHSATVTRFVTGILAGDRQDGTPPEQMLVMPQLVLPPELVRAGAAHGERPL